MIGSTLSHYRIVDELGRGGMGIVYRAEDTKLDRTVAIKVLPSAALASADDRERFYREAKSAAALNHPNIAQVYQIDEAIPSDAPHGTEPSPFIAMEYIAGGTLQDKIKEKPLSLSDAVKIASQVAEALKAAHAKNIVHRDIKSANVMITPDGMAKVLDFGLAKTSQSTKLTRMGSTLGTIAYMSPEQARSEEVDGRTDLWALGVVLYEMITGGNPFGGDYEQAVIYNILNEDPEPVTALRTGVPMALESITAKALRKDANQRYQTAADMIADLSAVELAKGSGLSAIGPESRETQNSGEGAWLQPATAMKSVVFVVLGVIFGMWINSFWEGRSPSVVDSDPVRRFDLSTLPYMNADYPMISSRGNAISYEAFDTSSGTEVLALYDLETMETRELVTDSDLFHFGFSPDGDWILYGVPNGLRIVRSTGGQSLDIAAVSFAAGSWENNESVVFREAGNLYRVGVDGLPPVKIVTADSLRGHRDFAFPVVVQGTSLVFSSLHRDDGGFDLGLVDTETGKYEVVLEDAVFVDYTTNGFLLYRSEAADGPLLTRRYDVIDRIFVGRPLPLSLDEEGGGFAAIGTEGSLVVAAQSAHSGSTLFELNLDSGALLPFQVPPGNYNEIAVSEDGMFLALEERLEAGGTAVMIVDLENGTKTRVNGSPRRDNPLFLDGETVIFDSRAAAQRKLYRQSIGGGEAEEIVTSNNSVSEPFLHPDGDQVVYRHIGPEQNDEIRSISVSTGEELVLAAPGRLIFDPSVSPDGNFVAYEAIRVDDGTAVNEVHVSSVGGEGSWTVGTGPTNVNDHSWSHDGRHLYFSDADVLYRVRVLEGSGFRFSRKEVVAKVPAGSRMALDTRRNRAIIISSEAAVNPKHVPIRLVQNYTSFLDDLIPESE